MSPANHGLSFICDLFLQVRGSWRILKVELEESVLNTDRERQ